jgi:alpha-tubulin suppressor-like RCC1 family protein
LRALSTYHACAVVSDKTARCWGYNIYGQLGDNTTTIRTLPAAVATLTDAAQIAAGYGHTVFRTGTGEVWTVGYNSDGQLGDNAITNRTAPVKVTTLSSVRQRSGGR